MVGFEVFVAAAIDDIDDDIVDDIDDDEEEEEEEEEEEDIRGSFFGPIPGAGTLVEGGRGPTETLLSFADAFSSLSLRLSASLHWVIRVGDSAKNC